MKFKYLKLTLLMAAISAAPFAMHAKADIEGAAQLILELTDTKGPKKSIEQTIGMVDQIIARLQDEPEYNDVCSALRELKDTLVRFNVAQAQGILGRVTNQLQSMYGTLSEGMKHQLNLRKEQLARLNIFEKKELLGKLGLNIPKELMRSIFGK